MPEEFEDSDFYLDDEDREEQTVWTCGCGTVVPDRQMGGMCPTCGAYMEEEPMY